MAFGDELEFGWAILARVEGEDSLFPPEERLTADVLRRMADSYDPGFRRAPVISGYDVDSSTAGPAHFVGEVLPPLGFVEELSFDGRNLWGRLTEREGKDGRGLISRSIRQLWLIDRSVGFWRKLRELRGAPPYLRHVALLAAEPAGIPAMPPMTEFVPDAKRSGLEPYFADAMQNADAARVVASAQFECRSLSDLPTEGKNPAAVPPTKGVRAMDEEQLQKAIQKAMATGLADVMRTGPVADAIAASQAAAAESARVAQEALAEAKALRTANAEAETRALDARVDTMIRTGRLTPAEATDLRALLADLPVEKRAAHLERAEKRERSLRSLSVPFVDEMPENVTFPTRRFSLPKEAGRSAVDPDRARQWGELQSRSGGDQTKYRTLAYAGQEV